MKTKNNPAQKLAILKPTAKWPYHFRVCFTVTPSGPKSEPDVVRITSITRDLRVDDGCRVLRHESPELWGALRKRLLEGGAS